MFNFFRSEPRRQFVRKSAGRQGRGRTGARGRGRGRRGVGEGEGGEGSERGGEQSEATEFEKDDEEVSTSSQSNAQEPSQTPDVPNLRQRKLVRELSAPTKSSPRIVAPLAHPTSSTSDVLLPSKGSQDSNSTNPAQQKNLSNYPRKKTANKSRMAGKYNLDSNFFDENTGEIRSQLKNFVDPDLVNLLQDYNNLSQKLEKMDTGISEEIEDEIMKEKIDDLLDVLEEEERQQGGGPH